MWIKVFKKFIKDMSLTKNPYFKKISPKNKLILKGHFYFGQNYDFYVSRETFN